MSHRYTMAAVFLTALAVPAAAQSTTSQPSTSQPSTTQSDTSKKSTSGVTTNSSNGSIAEPTTTPSTTTSPSTSAPSSSTTPSITSPSVTSPSTGASTGISTTPSTGASSSTGASASSAAGQVQPTSGVAKVDVKVAPSLANTVKISADSALALSRASFPGYEVSSAELEMKDKRLVYNVKMVKGSAASTVHVDGMTGEIVKDKKYGGLKAAVENQKESQKLYDAKKDSAATKKP